MHVCFFAFTDWHSAHCKHWPAHSNGLTGAEGKRTSLPPPRLGISEGGEGWNSGIGVGKGTCACVLCVRGAPVDQARRTCRAVGAAPSPRLAAPVLETPPGRAWAQSAAGHRGQPAQLGRAPVQAGPVSRRSAAAHVGRDAGLLWLVAPRGRDLWLWPLGLLRAAGRRGGGRVGAARNPRRRAWGSARAPPLGGWAAGRAWGCRALAGSSAAGWAGFDLQGCGSVLSAAPSACRALPAAPTWGWRRHLKRQLLPGLLVALAGRAQVHAARRRGHPTPPRCDLGLPVLPCRRGSSAPAGQQPGGRGGWAAEAGTRARLPDLHCALDSMATLALSTPAHS